MRLSWENPLCCKIIARVFPVKAIRLKYEIRSARESAYKKVSASLKKMRISPLFEGMDTCAKLKSLAAAGFFSQ